jgi:dihydropteroate synthase
MPTKLMGILNITPDSFFEESRFFNHEDAINRGIEIYQQGADILDVGGESSRPGAKAVSEAEELERVIPVIKALHAKIPIPISIDTAKAKVAAAAVASGATLINDISGFSDPEMQEVAVATGVDICLMHMQGIPQNMQENPKYSNGVVPYLRNWFECQIDILLKRGVSEKKIILDPGIGFGKTVAHNLEILREIAQFKALGFRVLVGISRKSFMSKILEKKTAELLPATLALNALLISQEVDIIRVHDVKEHRDVIEVLKRYRSAC